MARSKKATTETKTKEKCKPDKPKHKMTPQEKLDLDALYAYVRFNVMGYDENQSLSKTMVLRLKGLLKNKFIENYSIEDTANYSYTTILNTFKYCISEIQKGLRNNSFRDEIHKFNYVMRIVESNLNTVYIREKNAKKAIEEVSHCDTSDALNYVNNFKASEINEQNDEKYSDLW